MLRVVIEDYPQKSNVNGMWTAKGSVRNIKKSTQSRESPYASYPVKRISKGNL